MFQARFPAQWGRARKDTESYYENEKKPGTESRQGPYRH